MRPTHVNATIDFEELERPPRRTAKSLMRMLALNGSPTAINLLDIMSRLAQSEGAVFQVELFQTTEAAKS